MNEKDKREQDKKSRKKKKLSERIKRLARSDLQEINETIRNFHNGIGRAAKDTVGELRAIKQLLKDEIWKKKIYRSLGKLHPHQKVCIQEEKELENDEEEAKTIVIYLKKLILKCLNSV